MAFPPSVPEHTGTSPAASGPAGAQFEGRVAVHYLLTMLAEAEPRGFPGTSIVRVELQREGEGYPLDDVIVHCQTRAGDNAVLEIQVKRTITFAPKDSVFEKVVQKQLAKAFDRLTMSSQLHQFAVAIDKTSANISGSYQDVLRWAREVESADVFITRIQAKGVGSAEMRSFVKTVRSHLNDAGSASDDEAVWQLLRRFQILVFDFDAPGSQSEELAVERARSLLDPSESGRATALWECLFAKAIDVDASGGGIDRVRLKQEIENHSGFHLLGSRRNTQSRQYLAEAARNAVGDLRRDLAKVTLLRTGLFGRLREALSQSRYIEIRGDAGVGKSGLLGMLADQVLTEGQAIVLTPSRTPAGGWPAFRKDFEIKGEAGAFFTDLACGGGTVLFIDSIDFFDDQARRDTVNDLIRAVATVPVFKVVVTARTDSDESKLNWLPPEAFEQLGEPCTVTIDELEKGELEELSTAAPQLRALLEEEHPARNIARNLFRLSRLLERKGPVDQFRSEVDLLERWWNTADGQQQGVLKGQRLIADLADAALTGRDHPETCPDEDVVEALKSRGTLCESGWDNYAFCHDIFRDWGIAALLHKRPEKLSNLPLSTSAPARLARGVELGARFTLERAGHALCWREYLERLSGECVHSSWRRWSLLAIVRSEVAESLLKQESALLLADDGRLLQELLRTVYSVESRPFSDVWVAQDAKQKKATAGIFVPKNRSWVRLIDWLLSISGELPLQVLPDITRLFQDFAMATLCRGDATASMANVLVDWLEDIENEKDTRHSSPGNSRFGKALGQQKLNDLEIDIRNAFCLMARCVPERAQRYLHRQMARHRDDHTIKNILKFRGTLAQAAPDALAELTLAGFIPKRKLQKRYQSKTDVFSSISDQFLPSSPSQGPFSELLNEAPAQGLKLIHTLVQHAISTRQSQEEGDESGFWLELPDGPRFFPCKASYTWSRQADGYYILESALLALEAWGHKRIESGDAVESVLKDILGPQGSCAAFLLVAVDLVISNWRMTAEAAIPFLGSAELLAYDQIRLQQCSGFQQQEVPEGLLSRRVSLEALLPMFVLQPPGAREKLRTLLTEDSERLGLPAPEDYFSTPRFMARYALNRTNPANYRPQEEAGNQVYVVPDDERRHLEHLQQGGREYDQNLEIESVITRALEGSAVSDPKLTEQAVQYAHKLEAISDSPDCVLSSRTCKIVTAALLVVRDGDNNLLARYEDWVRDVFHKQLGTNGGRSIAEGSLFRYNPVAIATLGQIYLYQRLCHKKDRNFLLDVAGCGASSAASGFGKGIEVIRTTDSRLIQSLLRCALVAQVCPIDCWDTADDVRERNQVQRHQRIADWVGREISWLNDTGMEPEWPKLPLPAIDIRELRAIDEVELPATTTFQASNKFLSKSAALWLQELALADDGYAFDWVVSFVDAYLDWTVAANGASYEKNADINNIPKVWNSTFFQLLVKAFSNMSEAESARIILRLSSVPDVAFLDIARNLLSCIDCDYFDQLGLGRDIAQRMRLCIINHLTKTDAWKVGCTNPNLSVSSPVGQVVSIIFFNNISGPCYLTEKGIDLVYPFLVELGKLVDDFPVRLVAPMVMNILEVSPRPAHSGFLLSNVLVWLQRQPDNTDIWINSGLGVRVVKWLEEVTKVDAETLFHDFLCKDSLKDVISRLIRVGVADASIFEEKYLLG